MDKDPGSQIEELPATYTGILPCESCPGIEYDIQLMNDSFASYSFHRDSGREVISESGTWTLKNDTLYTYVDDQLYKAFLYSKNQLIMLDENLEERSGELAGRYQLESSADEESIRQHHIQLKEEGVRFVASGNEPFWNAKIDSNNTFIYSTPGFEIKANADEFEYNEGMINLKAVSDSVTFTLEIRRWICHDSMSGFPFTHEVTLQTNSEVQLYGCGLFLNE